MKRIVVLFALVSSLAATACGDEDTDTPVAAPRATEGTEREGVAVGGGGRVATVGKGASRIRIEVASRGLAYKTEHVTVEAGETLLRLVNPQSTPHDVDLAEADGRVVADMETIGQGYADVPIDSLPPGEYVFYCSVPGHREAGMEGTVTVKG